MNGTSSETHSLNPFAIFWQDYKSMSLVESLHNNFPTQNYHDRLNLV
jgi:hypothetical protein